MKKQVYAESRYHLKLMNGFVLNLRGLNMEQASKDVETKKFFTTPKGFIVHSYWIKSITEIRTLDVPKGYYEESGEVSEETFNKLQKGLKQ